jgi:hypothetical protein
MTKPKYAILIGAAALAAIASPAFATDNVYNPSSYAFANTFGPFVAGGQTSQVQTQILNGVVGETYDSTGGGLFSATGSADGYFNSASVASNTGNTAAAAADLHFGTVKASVTNGNGPLTRGFAQARIQDTVFFNNTSGGNLLLRISFGFDGSIDDTRVFGSTASAIFSLNGATAACPDGSFGTCAGDLSLRLLGGGTANMTTVIGYASNGSQNGVQQGGAFFFNAPDNVDLANYSVFKDWNSTPGYYNTVVSTTFVLPTGLSRVGFDLRLILDCSEVGTICDFGHTGKFGFAALPTGLSYTSASGNFLTGVAPTGGVPEPASWAMLIAGFGLTGANLRRRRRNWENVAA